jgi:peptide/nickel transport system substrate-binding protein
MTTRRTLLGAAAAAPTLFAIGKGTDAQAQRAQDTLRVVMRTAVTNVDPYYNQLRAGLVIAHHAWDNLLYRDPDTFQLKPLLATGWQLIDDTTLEFELRRGVRFHNGDPFTADDVVYTLNTVSAADSRVSVPSNVNWIDTCEKLGDFKVRIRMKRPTPPALEYLALTTPIYPAAYRTRVGAEQYAKEPVGAGPYRITRVDASRVEFERFNDYYAGSPKGRPAIGKMVFRWVPDAATEMTELLAGRADFIWNFIADQFDQVARMPNLQAIRQESMRIGYMQIDAAGRTGAGNPLTHQKVRQAIWHAIDLEQIARELVQGGSRVPAAPCYPTQFGCDQEAAVRYDYNPAKARQLLAEAGFPNGFETELVTYVLPTYGAAVQSYLAAVGIRARISQLQVQAQIQRAHRGENPLQLGSWGSFSINDVQLIFPQFFGGGADDYARDPELIRLVQEGGSTNDAEARRRIYAQVIRRATEQAYFIPMHTYVTTYGLPRHVEFTAHPDELPRFYRARWR